MRNTLSLQTTTLLSSLFGGNQLPAYNYAKEIKALKNANKKHRKALKREAFQDGHAASSDVNTPFVGKSLDSYKQGVIDASANLLAKIYIDLTSVQLAKRTAEDELKKPLEQRANEHFAMLLGKKLEAEKAVNWVDTEKIKNRMETRGTQMVNLKANMEVLEGEIGKGRLSNEFLFKSVFDGAFIVVVTGGEMAINMGLFIEMGMGVSTAPVTSLVISAMMAGSSLLAGRFSAEEDNSGSKKMLGIGAAIIGGLGVARLAWDRAHVYMIGLNAIVYYFGYQIARYTALPKQYFRYKAELKKLERQQTKDASMFTSGERSNREKQDGINVNWQTRALEIANAEDKKLKNNLLESTDNEKTILAQQKEVEDWASNSQKGGEADYLDYFKRGQNAKNDGGGSGGGNLTLWIVICMVFLQGCDYIDTIAKIYKAPVHHATDIVIDRTQRPENRNPIDTAAITDFYFGEIFSNDSYAPRDAITVYISPINDLYITGFEKLTLPPAGSDYNVKKRKTQFNDFRNDFVNRIYVDTSKSFGGLTQTRLHEALGNSLRRLLATGADHMTLIVASDVLENSPLANFYKGDYEYDPKRILENADLIEEALMNHSPWPDSLQAITVYFAYTPNISNQERVHYAQQYFKRVFEKRGAKVIIRGGFLPKGFKQFVRREPYIPPGRQIRNSIDKDNYIQTEMKRDHEAIDAVEVRDSRDFNKERGY